MTGFKSGYLVSVAVIAAAVWMAPAGHADGPVGTAFTYQGELTLNGQLVDESSDLRFSLWDDLAAGGQIGVLMQVDDHPVVNGRFTAQLDFGDVFDGQARFLEIAVRSPAGVGGFTTLSPRQELTPAPYAVFSSLPWQTDGNNIHFDGALVGIGTNAPQFRLDVRSPAPRAIFGWTTNETGNTWGVFGQSASNQGVGVQGSATANDGAAIGVAGHTSSPQGFAGYFTGVAGSRSYFQQRLGVGTESPNSRLHVNAIADETPFRAQIAGLTRMILAPNGGAAIGVNNNSPPERGLHVFGDVGIGTSAPGRKLHVTDESIGLNDNHLWDTDVAVIEDFDAVLGLYSDAGGNWGSGIVLGQVNTGTGELSDKWAIIRRTTASGGGLQFRYGSDRQHTSESNPSMLTLRTDGRVAVQVLEIQGADLAERFPVSEPDFIEPGTVMEIDPRAAGKLRIAQGAYNRRVAGVLSGAGELPTGAILGNLSSEEENDGPPIALSGRVWVLCDAAGSPIEPGDLLTTSERPGHAMAVVDHNRASGAIIGKAMSGLAQGERGLVLVLVSLQ